MTPPNMRPFRKASTASTLTRSSSGRNTSASVAPVWRVMTPPNMRPFQCALTAQTCATPFLEPLRTPSRASAFKSGRKRRQRTQAYIETSSASFHAITSGHAWILKSGWKPTEAVLSCT